MEQNYFVWIIHASKTIVVTDIPGVLDGADFCQPFEFWEQAQNYANGLVLLKFTNYDIQDDCRYNAQLN